MRIGLLTTSFPRFPGDAAGAFVLGFARALASRGHHVEVLAPEPPEPLSPPSFPGLELHFVPYMRPRSWARTFYGAGVPDNLRRDARAWLGVGPFCAALLAATQQRRVGWDAIVSHWALPCGLLAAGMRQTRPHLCVFHSADLHLLGRLPMRGAIAEHLARGATQLLFVSEQHRERFLAWLGPATRLSAASRAHVEPMGIEPSPPESNDRAKLRAALGLDRFTLLTLARLVPVKGLGPAIEALAARDDLEWMIAGEGPERTRLERLAAAGRMRVRLLGHVSGPTKHDLLRAADAFVMPSVVLPSGRSEGVPTAALEAMAHGLPVIAAAVGGLPEVVRHAHSGLLYDPADPTQLAVRIDALRGDPELARQLAQRAEVAVRRHHWDELAPRLDALLR